MSVSLRQIWIYPPIFLLGLVNLFLYNNLQIYLVPIPSVLCSVFVWLNSSPPKRNALLVSAFGVYVVADIFFVLSNYVAPQLVYAFVVTYAIGHGLSDAFIIVRHWGHHTEHLMFHVVMIVPYVIICACLVYLIYRVCLTSIGNVIGFAFYNAIECFTCWLYVTSFYQESVKWRLILTIVGYHLYLITDLGVVLGLYTFHLGNYTVLYNVVVMVAYWIVVTLISVIGAEEPPLIPILQTYPPSCGSVTTPTSPTSHLPPTMVKESSFKITF